MGKLKGRGLPSRLGAAPRRLGSAPVGEAERHRQRDAEVQWRKWYKTARWQRLRLSVIARDGCVCQQTGKALIGVHPAPNSPVVDHKTPHRGDAALFWDPDNLQTVSKEWHDRVKQAMEKRGDA